MEISVNERVRLYRVGKTQVMLDSLVLKRLWVLKRERKRLLNTDHETLSGVVGFLLDSYVGCKCCKKVKGVSGRVFGVSSPVPVHSLDYGGVTTT